MLARKGHAMNHKKLYRLYHEERLMVRRPMAQARAGDAGTDDVAQRDQSTLVTRLRADALSDGRRFRILCIVDDFSRECLATVVDTFFGGVRVVRELQQLGSSAALPG